MTDDVPEGVLDRLAELYEEHRQAAFPRRLTVADPHGVEMVSLDSDVSGCVDVWLRNEGRIDDRRWDVLSECEQRLNRAIPALDGCDRSYCQRLRDMTLLILDTPGSSGVDDD